MHLAFFWKKIWVHKQEGKHCASKASHFGISGEQDCRAHSRYTYLSVQTQLPYPR